VSARTVLMELLVLRAQSGERDAVELLVQEWQPRLRAHARRMTGDDIGADDVSQETWVRILRGLRSLEDPQSFGPWAYRIASLASADWVRKRARQRNHEAAVKVQALPTTTAATERLSNDVGVAVRKLSAEQQAILHLRYVDGYGIEQIAEALAIPAGTVKSRLFHAREHLRQLLERSK